MFQWAAQGIAPSVIASYANALGWITGGGKPWTPRQVLSILSNHVYAGLVEYGIGFRQGCHVPLIDRDVYHKVQNWIAARRTAIRCGGRKAHGNAPSGRPAGVNGSGARQPSRAVRGIENGLSGQVPQLFAYASLRQAKRSTATRHLRTRERGSGARLPWLHFRAMRLRGACQATGAWSGSFTNSLPLARIPCRDGPTTRQPARNGLPAAPLGGFG